VLVWPSLISRGRLVLEQPTKFEGALVSTSVEVRGGRAPAAGYSNHFNVFYGTACDWRDHDRDRHRVGAHAVARNAAGGVGGVEEG
jgi:hypothetical protein